MQDFSKILFWQRSHDLVLKYYKITKSFPKEEIFGMTSQVRRAAASIPANIAEGCGRNSNPQLRNYLQISAGSASELQYHTLLCKDLGYISEQDYQYLSKELVEIRKMIFAFSNKL